MDIHVVAYGLDDAGLEAVFVSTSGMRSNAIDVAANRFLSGIAPTQHNLNLRLTIIPANRKDLFVGWLAQRVYRGLRAFPVDRAGNDVGAIKEALRRLAAGYAIGVFFEGTRNIRGDAVAQQGAAFLAQRSGAPLVPAAIWREGRSFRVAFGPALIASDRSREAATRLTAELEAAVKALIPAGGR